MRWRVLIGWLVCCASTSAACRKADTPTGPSPTGPIVYGVVGASDGIGFGGSVPCLPWDPDCPSGTGYVYVLKRRLQSEGRTVTLVNRAFPGLVLSDAMLALGRDIGRDDIPGTFMERAVPFLTPDTTHITVFAGGNDTNVIAQNIRAGRGAADVRAFIDTHVRQFGVDYEEMVRRLRAITPNARIVALNLPNLGVAPYVARNTVQERSIVQRIAVGMTDRMNALASQNVLVVDLMCDPRIYEASSYSSDGFHPSDRGYALMAELVYPALAHGTASTPSSTCAQRRQLPAF